MAIFEVFDLNSLKATAQRKKGNYSKKAYNSDGELGEEKNIRVLVKA